MIRYFTRSRSDCHHLYKLDEDSGKFYYMDHCWTGEGIWYERDYPTFDIIEIDEEWARKISNGNLEGSR